MREASEFPVMIPHAVPHRKTRTNCLRANSRLCRPEEGGAQCRPLPCLELYPSHSPQEPRKQRRVVLHGTRSTNATCSAGWQQGITAFEQLYRHYAPRLVTFLRSRLGLSELVEEVLNDVMLVVWRRAAMFQPTSCVSTWLFGIARHKAYKARSPHHQPSPAEPPGGKSGNGHANPEEMLSHQERYRLITCALMTLPPEQRIVVELTYYCSCSSREIAQQLGEAEATVRSRLRLARQRLASSLAQQGLA
jgi:RNA polymerase sigma-70 factor, ECF subfamily